MVANPLELDLGNVCSQLLISDRQEELIYESQSSIISTIRYRRRLPIAGFIFDNFLRSFLVSEARPVFTCAGGWYFADGRLAFTFGPEDDFVATQSVSGE